eukprot:819320-Rhodomonas_salina.1
MPAFRASTPGSRVPGTPGTRGIQIPPGIHIRADTGVRPISTPEVRIIGNDNSIIIRMRAVTRVPGYPGTRVPGYPVPHPRGQD